MTINLSTGRLSAAIVCSAIAVMAPSLASAVTFTVGEIGQLTSTEPGATTVDFESGAPTSGNAIYSGNGQVVTGNAPNLYAKPYRLPDDTQYLTLGAQQNTAIDFAPPAKYFGLFFGSADLFNRIAFVNDGKLLAEYTGEILLGDGSQDRDDTNRYVNFFAEGEETFDQVFLGSDSYAFETDNHAYKVVPEPSSALGILAMGAFGAGSLLQRKLKQKV